MGVWSISSLKIEVFCKLQIKKWPLRLIFLIERKKIKNKSSGFWHRKLTLKVRFWHFWTEPHYVNLRNKTFSLKLVLLETYFFFLYKIKLICNPSDWAKKVNLILVSNEDWGGTLMYVDSIMVIGVVQFSNGGYKIRKIFA